MVPIEFNLPFYTGGTHSLQRVPLPPHRLKRLQDQASALIKRHKRWILEVTSPLHTGAYYVYRKSLRTRTCCKRVHANELRFFFFFFFVFLLLDQIGIELGATTANRASRATATAASSRSGRVRG